MSDAQNRAAERMDGAPQIGGADAIRIYGRMWRGGRYVAA